MVLSEVSLTACTPTNAKMFRIERMPLPRGLFKGNRSVNLSRRLGNELEERPTKDYQPCTRYAANRTNTSIHDLRFHRDRTVRGQT